MAEGSWGGALAAGLLVLGASGLATAAEDALARHRGARILVLAAPEAGDARLQAQRAALAGVGGGLAERDLVVVEAVGAGAEAARLRARLGLPPDAFRAVLVGRDGGAKLTAAEPVSPQRLFATIDAMPMRQEEMRQEEMRRGSR